jgi:hypothetical protein
MARSGRGIKAIGSGGAWLDSSDVPALTRSILEKGLASRQVEAVVLDDCAAGAHTVFFSGASTDLLLWPFGRIRVSAWQGCGTYVSPRNNTS